MIQRSRSPISTDDRSSVKAKGTTEQSNMEVRSTALNEQSTERENIGSISKAVARVKREYDCCLEEAQREYELDFQVIAEARNYLGTRNQDLQKEIQKLHARLEDNKVELRRNELDAQQLELRRKRRKEIIEANRGSELDKIDRDMAKALAEIRSSQFQRSTNFLSVGREKSSFEEEVVSQPRGPPAVFTFEHSNKETERRTILRSVEDEHQIKPDEPGSQSFHVLPSQPTIQTSPHHSRLPSETLKEQTGFVIIDGYYTSPECMKGVPATKLVEGDGYWKPSWKLLKNWRIGVEQPYRTPKTTSFFGKYPIHPNQLIAKKYYSDTGLCTGQVPEILRIIFERLEDFNIADPVQWMRGQLAYLISLHEKEGGSSGSFNLRKFIMNFRDSNSEFKMMCWKEENKIFGRIRKPAKRIGEKVDRDFIDRSTENKNRKDSQATPESAERPFKRQCVLRAPRIVFDYDIKLGSSDEELLASRKPNAITQELAVNQAAHNGTHGISSKGTTPNHSQSTTSKTASETPVSSIPLATTKTLKGVSQRESSLAIPSLSHLTLKHNVSFDIRSMTVGTQEWQNPTSAKLEFCVAQLMFVPSDEHASDSAMKPYRIYAEFQIRPADIAGLRVRTAVLKNDMASMQKLWGDTIVNVAFRKPEDCLAFAALVLLYNEKVKMTDNVLQRLEQVGFVAYNRVTETLVEKLQSPTFVLDR